MWITRCNAATGTVDVHVDRLLGALRLQEEELRNDDAGHHVVDGAHQADDPLLQKTRVDVVSSFAAAYWEAKKGI